MDVIGLEGVTLRVNAALAAEIGLNESIVLLQIEWWIRHSTNERDGKRWTYQSLSEMNEKAFPFWSKDTINRAVNNLLAREFIEEGNFNRHQYDKTRWFALNCEAINALAAAQIQTSTSQDRTSTSQNEKWTQQNRTTIPETPQKNPSKEKLIKFPQTREEDSFSDGVDSDKSISKKERDDKSGDGLSYCVNRWGQDVVDRAVIKAQKYGAMNVGGYVRRILENAEAKGEIGVHSNPLVRSMAGSPSPLNPLSHKGRGDLIPEDVTPEREKSTEEMAWDAAYGQLELQLDASNFSTWVRDVVYVGADGGVYVLKAKNTYARDMLQHRLYRNIRRVLSDVLGAEVELRFVVDGEAVAS